MVTLEELARRIAAEPTTRPLAVPPGTAARQGDVVLRPVARPAGAPTPKLGAAEVLAAGRHGAHVALGAVAVVGDVLVVGEEGAVLIHTDEPHARHGALTLGPGAWTVSRVRELSSTDLLPQEVAD